MSDSLRRELAGIIEKGQQIDLPIRDALYEHLQRGKEIVLFGAGNLGRQIAEVLLQAGVNVVCFCDNQRALWESTIKSIFVLSPDEAVSRYGASAFFIVAIWHPCRTSDVLNATEQLRSLGAMQVTPFSFLLERFPVLLPRMFWSPADQIISHAEDIEHLFDFLADDVSKQCLLNALRLRLFHDFNAANHVSDGRQYFPHDLYRLGDDEVFVDCGAFDGDSLADFIAESGGKFHKVIAFEADPRNFEKLRTRAANSGYSHLIDTRDCAVGAHDGAVRFAAEGVAAASVCETGGIEVCCTKLDTALDSEHPTIIKMDIEGDEAEALSGVGAKIKNDNPILAICVYHRPEDLWRLPAQMHALMPESRPFMRSHCADGFDLVSYAVPTRRLHLRSGI